MLEETFRDYALGNAANRPRAHSYAPRRYEPVQWYMLKTMDAILPRYRVGGIRLTSDIVIEKLTDGKMRREKPRLAPAGRCTELVFLFSVLQSTAKPWQYRRCDGDDIDFLSAFFQSLSFID